MLRPPLIIVKYVWHPQNDPTEHPGLPLRVVTAFNVFFIILLYRMPFYLQKNPKCQDTALELKVRAE